MADKENGMKTFAFRTYFVGRDWLRHEFIWVLETCVSEPSNYVDLAWSSLYPGKLMAWIHEKFGTDAVGFLVKGVIWSDERPFFDGLLENNQRYDIVYNKPWFWETERLEEDKEDGIIWENMYPRAPVDRNHPCMHLKN